MPRGQGGGPKTTKGKARSSRNAVKHGFRVSPGRPHPYIIEGLEDPAEWEALRQGIIESTGATGVLEEEIATNIAHGYWKLRRSQLFENRVLSKSVASTARDLYEELASSLGLDFVPGDDSPIDPYASLPSDGLTKPSSAVESEANAGSAVPASPDARSDQFIEFPDIEPERLVRHQELRVLPDGWEIDRMLRIEAFVRKALSQDMRELETQQARRDGIKQPLARVVFSSDPSPAKIHRTANDMPEFMIARERVRMAEATLAERRLARKGGDT